MKEETKTKIDKAVHEGRAYLNTTFGKRKIKSYNYETGNCVTNNTNDFYQQRTFLVCIDAIQIEKRKTLTELDRKMIIQQTADHFSFCQNQE